MQWLVAIQPLSVRKALTMGVSSATRSAASLRSSSSSLDSSLSISSAVYIASARPPSA
jgi:hypothetical protein